MPFGCFSPIAPFSAACKAPSQNPLEPCQVLVNKLHRNRSFAHRRGHALYRTVPHIAGHKHTRHAGLKQVRLPRFSPAFSHPALTPPSRPRSQQMCFHSAPPPLPAKSLCRPPTSTPEAISSPERLQ